MNVLFGIMHLFIGGEAGHVSNENASCRILNFGGEFHGKRPHGIIMK
jgi:hypothetical protein